MPRSPSPAPRRAGAQRPGSLDRPRPSPGQWLQVWVIAGAVGALYLAHSLLRFRNFEAKGYDLGIFDQAVRQYALFREPLVAVKGLDFNLLGDHFHPLIALLAPFYWVWPDPRMLNLIMIGLLLAAVPPVYLFTRRRLGHAPGVLIVAVLLLFWPFQSIVNWDFHEIALAVPLIAWILYCLDTRRFVAVCVLSLPLLGIREDLGATVMAIGIVLLIKRQWGKGVVLALVGLVGFGVIYGVVMPALRPDDGRNYFEYSALGPTVGAAAVAAITHPWRVIGLLFSHQLKLLWWVVSFVPFGLLSLASPYIIIAAPIILTRLLSDRLNVWAPVYQYDSVLLPILLLAFVDVLSKIIARTGRRRLALIGPAVPLLISLVGTAFIPALFPLQRTATGANHAEPEHARAQQRAVDMVPSGVCVEATDTAVPHLTNRTYVSLFEGMGQDLASWAIVDTTVEEMGGWAYPEPQKMLQRAKKLGFSVVSRDDNGIWVLHRDIPVDPLCSDYVPDAKDAPHL